MKKKLIALLVGLGIIALPLLTCVTPVALVTGCATTGTNGPVIDQATIDSTAIILRGAARAGVAAATTPPTGNPDNAQWFVLASASISTFITGKDYSPGAFQASLASIKSPALTNAWVQVGIGTVVDLYQLYYGQYVKGKVSSSQGGAVAIEFLTAIQDGFNEALGKPVSSALAASPSGARAAPTPSCPILPRPITVK